MQPAPTTTTTATTTTTMSSKTSTKWRQRPTALAAVLVLLSAPLCLSFQVRPLPNCRNYGSTTTTTQLLASSLDNSPNTAATTSTGFQSELATLQQDLGIPLLACDADQVHSFCTALWGLLARVSRSPHGQTACLVLERVPVSALRAFVQEYTEMQQTPRLMAQLPELERIALALVGEDDEATVGPAILIQSTTTTTTTTTTAVLPPPPQQQQQQHYDQDKCIAATQSFVQRMVVGEEACPYTKDPHVAATGLEKKGIAPGPVAYRFDATEDACGALAAFWNATAEVMTTSETELSTTLLSLPGMGPGTNTKAHDRFAAVTEVMGRQLCLFRGDGTIGLVHFHPAYDRARIVPHDKPAYGHLPPLEWLPAMLHRNGNTRQAAEFTTEDYRRSNYQRRSPHTVINILRAAQLGAAVGGQSIVELDVNGDGSVMEAASGISTYSRNAIRLANMDAAVLEAGVQDEIDMMGAEQKRND